MTRSIVRLAAGLAPAMLALSVPAFAEVPVCNHNGPYVAECTGQQTPVAVTSAGSFDPDGSVTFFWFEECTWGFFDDPTSAAPNMVIDLLGGCIQTCVFALRVSQGGETTSCVSTVTVQDTTAPVIICPPDFTEIWAGGIPAGQTDPALTGFATASDCDPAPVIGYVDISIVPGTMAGEPEVIITREWTATDYCLNASTCIQIITLLSPSSAAALGAVLDVRPGSCPNEISVSSEGVLTTMLFGTTAFDATQIDRTTVALRRMDNVGGAAVRVNTRLLDKGRPGAASNPSCSSSILDGRVDLQLTFSLAQVCESLELAAEAPNGAIEFAITGRMLDGRYFTVRDHAVIVD